MTASSLWLFVGAVNGLIAVAGGAYARHGPLSASGAEWFAFGSNYQLMHALALIGVAWLASRPGSRWASSAVTVAGLSFSVGIVLFSGSLYWLGWRETLLIEGAAPMGGMLLMLGWLALAVSALLGWQRSAGG
jgi:uncharacterized membrane protein YgdD (TMEM256/DUF423 family)